ncbi:MAG: glycosyltransferase family 2 protein [Bacteroidaceae bacterium]
MNPDNTLPSSETSDSSVPPSEPQKPLITIATVTYNAAQTLERTLLSVASQDYPRIEHLIVDGCSTDRTLSVVQQYVAENTRTSHPHHIRLISEPDNGLYDAMNKAINNASGDYLVFLNAGDCLHDVSTISQAVACADWQKGDSRNPAVLYGETDLVDAEGRFLRHRRLSAPERLTSRSFLNGMLVCHQSFYVRTDLARLIPYDLRYRFSADYDWCIRMMLRAEKRRLEMINTHLILTDYLSEGMTTRNHKASLMERLRIMAHHFGWGRALMSHAWFVIRAFIKR